MNEIHLADVVSQTGEIGGGWAIAHARRLSRLIEMIGEGLEYDPQALAWAVYLHDWGAYPRYAQAGVEHPTRSKQVAESEILPHTNDLSPQAKATVLEAIELHDYHDTRPVSSNEALLLREADYLDFLGAVGIARGFAGAGKDLPKGLKIILSRKELVQARIRFVLPPHFLFIIIIHHFFFFPPALFFCLTTVICFLLFFFSLTFFFPFTFFFFFIIALPAAISFVNIATEMTVPTVIAAPIIGILLTIPISFLFFVCPKKRHNLMIYVQNLMALEHYPNKLQFFLSP